MGVDRQRLGQVLAAIEDRERRRREAWRAADRLGMVDTRALDAELAALYAEKRALLAVADKPEPRPLPRRQPPGVLMRPPVRQRADAVPDAEPVTVEAVIEELTRMPLPDPPARSHAAPARPVARQLIRRRRTGMIGG